MKTRHLLLFLSGALSAAGLTQLAAIQTAVVNDTVQARAERVETVFEEIESDHWNGNPAPKSHRIEEADLNAFLDREVQLQAPRGVERLTVDLKSSNVFVTFLTIDMDEVELSESMAAGVMATLFGGKQKLDVEGRLKTADGVGSYEVLGARLNGFPLPAAVVASLLRAVGNNLEPPFDPTEPFALTHGIRRVEIKADQAIIYTAPAGN